MRFDGGSGVESVERRRWAAVVTGVERDPVLAEDVEEAAGFIIARLASRVAHPGILSACIGLLNCGLHFVTRAEYTASCIYELKIWIPHMPVLVMVRLMWMPHARRPSRTPRRAQRYTITECNLAARVASLSIVLALTTSRRWAGSAPPSVQADTCKIVPDGVTLWDESPSVPAGTQYPAEETIRCLRTLHDRPSTISPAVVHWPSICQSLSDIHNKLGVQQTYQIEIKPSQRAMHWAVHVAHT
ncbi:hypothetical protein GY45DRAFT_551616 [Cubamyces sp. BRFM 1775]|nr:hypothetical protein GY45DRAFT_551616 [Cubamyces sp. BRFM 1775]